MRISSENGIASGFPEMLVSLCIYEPEGDMRYKVFLLHIVYASGLDKTGACKKGQMEWMVFATTHRLQYYLLVC